VPYSADLAPGNFWLFPKLEYEERKVFLCLAVKSVKKKLTFLFRILQFERMAEVLGTFL
jgi:hypothetical protein